jgi:dTDP-4-amino-4,6-dideoxygalactose transaminase
MSLDKPIRFFNPGLSYSKIRDEVLAAIDNVLSGGRLILQKELEDFEEQFAAYVGTKYAVGVANGTDALFLSLMALGVDSEDTILCPSYTFRATVDSALRTGAEVKLYDHEERPNFEGITVWIPAHIAGEVPDWMEDATEECYERGITVIEDFAQAIGAAPVRGATACYSFYPAKILGCYGDGGAIATDNPVIADYLKRARNHFKGEHGPVGLNSRLDNLQAAVLSIKLKYLPENIYARKRVAKMYDAGLKGVGLPNERQVYQDYIIYHEKAAELFDFLKERGIETMRNGYPFADGVEKGPKTLEYEEHSLRLPCNPDLEDEEVQRVIDTINEFTASV